MSELIAALPVHDEGSGTGYSRGAFRHWIDADGDGCNSPEAFLAEAVTAVDDVRQRREHALPRLPSALGYSESWTYDSAGNVTSHTDGRGNKTSYGYNSSSRRVQVDQWRIHVRRPDG